VRKIENEILGREAAALSLVEIGLGSILHGFKVPFTGYFLSLNQGFFLSRAVSQSRGLAGSRVLPFQISSVAACLKSLSPAGKKLTPMLAISMQGVFFTLGTATFGANLMGALVGSVVCSLWAFVQPLILYTLLYGKTLADVGVYYLDKFGLWGWVAGLLLLKCAIAAALAVAGFRVSQERFERYQALLLEAARARGAVPLTPGRHDSGWAGAASGALRDLTRPLFLASILLTGAFFWFNEHAWTEIFWKLLRPVALGFLLFFAVRTPLLLHLVQRLRRSRLQALGAGLESALQRVLRKE
jgi:hypothetical protein